MDAITITAPQQVTQRTIPALERQIDDAVAGRPAFVDVALGQVQVIDSAALNWLLAVQARLDTLGSRLRLASPSPIVADVLAATRLDTRFPVHGEGGPHGRG
jgi:anti-anti-sigma factor